MNNRELRIGNKLQKENGEVFTVLRLDNTSDVLVEEQRGLLTLNYNLFGIPLTEEWLLKFGFEKTYRSDFRLKFGHFLHNEIGFDFSKVEDKSMEGFRYYGHHIKIKYVHQLQNLFFTLTNEELTTR